MNEFVREKALKRQIELENQIQKDQLDREEAEFKQSMEVQMEWEANRKNKLEFKQSLNQQKAWLDLQKEHRKEEKDLQNRDYNM